MADPRKVRPEMKALVTELLERLAASDVRELEVRRNGLRVKVSKGGGGSAPAMSAPVGVPAVNRAVAAEPASTLVTSPTAAAASSGPQVTAPLTGIFYRSASPQAGPFVQVGSVVAAGDVVALIEAMKLFNEIRAEKGGVVRQVLAENGQLVKKFQPLFELDPV